MKALKIILAILIPFGFSLGESWEEAGPYGDEVYEICVAPQDPNLVYVSTESGIYKTTDGGENWEHIYGNSYCPAIAIDPKNPEVVYANAPRAKGIVKTIDGGLTWKEYVIEGYPDQGEAEIIGAKIIVAPSASNIVYIGIEIDYNAPRVAISGKIFRSENGGEDWQEITPQKPLPRIGKRFAVAEDGTVYGVAEAGTLLKRVGTTWVIKKYLIPEIDLLVDEVKEIIIVNNRIHVAHAYGKIRVSEDGGDNWLVVNFDDLRPIDLTVSSDGVMYATIEDHYKDKTVLKKTLDGGRTWSEVNDSVKFWLIEVAPSDSEILYSHLFDRAGIYNSTDGGKTWQKKSRGLYTHKVKELVSGATKVYALTEAGIFCKEKTQEWWSLMYSKYVWYWYPLRYEIRDVSSIVELTVDPIEDDVIYYLDKRTMPKGGVYVSKNSGESFSQLRAAIRPQTFELSNDGKVMVIIDNGGIVYLGQKQADDSWRWDERVSGVEVSSILITEGTVYLGTPDGVYTMSVTGGTAESLALAGVKVYSVRQSSEGQLLAATNDGVYEIRESKVFPAPRRVSFAPSRHRLVTVISKGLKGEIIKDVVSDSRYGMYAAGVKGVYKYSNDTNWVRINTGLENTEIDYLLLDTTSGILYAGAKGKPAFQYSLSDTSIKRVSQERSNTLLSLNPFTLKGFPLVNKEFKGELKVRVYNMLGQLVREIEVNSNSQVYWNAQGLPSGVYFYSISTDKGLREVKRGVMLK
jgi:photosystem II stability/assembly factor-like uncharacterized protein